MALMDALITFDNVSKFYGEGLGVNRVTLSFEPGITSMVGPNGAGKTTLMNLMTGLLSPTSGAVRVLGIPPSDSERLFRVVGYCPQFDSFPKGFTGHDFLTSILTLHGYGSKDSDEIAWQTLDKCGIADAADRRISGYSKGMRQRIKLAAATVHKPRVLVLDEPLNGLDPLSRAEAIRLFREAAASGMHVIISSHVLHEVDVISDRIVMLSNGYVVAEGGIRSVRGEMEDHPMQILVRCDRPALVASLVFTVDSVVEVKIHEDGRGLHISTRNPQQFYRKLNRIILENNIEIEMITPADENVRSVYEYLIGRKPGPEI
jgi:ABC-2 type transport system ATP-binding protein